MSSNKTEAPHPAETDSQLFTTLCEIDKHNYLFLFEKCKQFNVNARQLRYFEKDHIRNLIPPTQLGILAEFEYLLHEWKLKKGYIRMGFPNGEATTNLNGEIEEKTTSVFSRGIQTEEMHYQSIGVNTMPMENSDLNGLTTDPLKEDLLQAIENNKYESPKVVGQNHVYLLEDIIPSALARTKMNYRKKKLLTEGDRRLVAGAIVNYFESSNIKLVSQVMENLAEQITQHFPTESKKAWYDRHRSKGRGRLYMKFYNSHRNKNALYPYNKKRKSISEPENSLDQLGEFSTMNLTKRITYNNIENDETTSVSSIMDDIMIMDQDEGSKMVQTWLKSHKCEDFTEIMQMWQDTLNYRINQLKQLSDLESVTEFMENWPSYKIHRGYELLNYDFEHLYPNSMTIFRTRWMLYQQTIVPLFEAEIKDSNCWNILDQYKSNRSSLNEDTKSFILLYLLHAITKPYRVFKTAKGSVRYCISDSQYSVTRFIQHHSEMDSYREKYPCIFVLGNKLLDIKECFVCFRNIRYQLSFDDCLIACLQIFVIFKLEDPLPSLHFWQFVRGYLFNIQRETERPYAIMENVIQYLETAGKRIDDTI